RWSPVTLKRLVILAMLAVGACEGAPFGMIRLGALNLQGEVDSGYLERQLQQLEPRFQACYARALRLSRSDGAIHWRIKGGGGGLRPEVISKEPANDTLAACATSAIAGLGIVEPSGAKPWDYTLDWSVNFVIARRP